jgi:hypothetical protein
MIVIHTNEVTVFWDTQKDREREFKFLSLFSLLFYLEINVRKQTDSEQLNGKLSIIGERMLLRTVSRNISL